MKEKITALIKDWRTAAVLCLAIGLSPFYPEPHIVGKIKWIIGGELGSMGLLDWADFLYHSVFWVYLLYLLNKKFF